MRYFSSLPISRKLPAMIVTLCLAGCLSIAVVGYRDFERNILHETQKNIEIIIESRAQALTMWFDRLRSDVAAYGTDPTVMAAASAFANSYTIMVDGPALQAAYITNNPNPEGARDLFDQAPEAVPYHFQHGRFHPFFRQMRNTADYGDIFLLSLEGELMYSVSKRSDYATNVLSGPYAESGLAQAFAKAREGQIGQVFFADFQAYAPASGEAAAFVATPVNDADGRAIGVLAVQVRQGQIGEIVNNPNGLGRTGEIYLVGADLLARSASRFAGGHDMLASFAVIDQAAAALQGTSVGLTEGPGIGGEPVLSGGRPMPVFDSTWGLVGEITRQEVHEPVVLVRNKMVSVTLIVGLISVLVGGLAARSFVGPLGQLGSAMKSVSERDYSITLTEAGRRDEIGSLFRALTSFRDKLAASDRAEEERRALQDTQRKIVERLSLALGHLAEGDLTHKITTPFDGDYDQLRCDFNATVDRLNGTLGALVRRAGQIRHRSDTMSRGADDLSRRTENQAATLEETAAALDELTASVKSAAAGAKEVALTVTDARKDADESQPVVQSAVRAMNEIADSSQEISKIIGVIDDIAFQTNLLALNAGVEAARAGEAGRGFAVVASEVRALAQRSSTAAKQIKGLISQSAGQVREGVELVDEAGAVLTKIAGHINHISTLIGAIASGAEEQSTGLGEINIGVTQLDKVTQQNAAMVEEASASSHALNNDANELVNLVKRFTLAADADRDAEIDVRIDPRKVDIGTDQFERQPLRTVHLGQTAARQEEAFWTDF